jgi:surfeit locus 1 family protein
MKRPKKIAKQRTAKKVPERARWRRLLWPAIFTLIAFVFLCELGFWQLQRLAWKEDLIARVERRQQQSVAVPIPAERDWPNVGTERDEYRRVKAEGKYRYGRESFAYALLSNPRGKFSGPGYWVMTPLELAGGGIVIVNRGFVPMDRMDLTTRNAGPESAETTVTGLLRMPERRSWFTPPDDAARRIWQERDPAAIAKAYGLARVAPFYIDADQSGPNGYPQGGETRLTFPNDHLQYAVTWFGLALALLGVFLVYARREWRRGEFRDRA